MSKDIFVGATKRDKKGTIKEFLTPDGWVKAKIAPVKIWKKSERKGESSEQE